MYWNEEESFEAIEAFGATARDLRDAFEQHIDPDDLQAGREALLEKWRRVCDLLPAEVLESTNIARHLHFMGYYLDQGRTEGAVGDARDLATDDTYLLRRNFHRWLEAQSQTDPELADKTRTLLKKHEYDSAMRKAFVILKSRLVAKFGIGQGVDGAELVNLTFGSKSELSGLPPADRQAFRDLLSGLFGVFRNTVAHEDRVPTRLEVEAVFSMINFVLIRLESLPPKAPGPTWSV